ncbi:MAG: L-seryl-tRNA(Sec) selenium transferase [Planctomycetes bacterium]|nr:L-seryl-tRNA(Sec) selenium transferase [Planctomycetota bacterium]
MSSSYRALPSVDRVLRDEAVAVHAAAVGAEMLRRWVGEVIEELRDAVRRGRAFEPAAALGEAVAAVSARAQAEARPYHRRVLNATGILAHTGLGRAPLAAEATEALLATAGASVVELEIESGRRGVREERCAEMICALTGAAAATVVNNNAAATLLGLKTLSEGREAILSRGELVEIGGAFRMPEVMEQGGVLLREVGATNRTRLEDYERAIGAQTGLLLKVHPSNYRIQGFTAQVELRELVELGRRRGIAVMEDLGSGLLLERRDVLPGEPRVRESVQSGADLVCFSGDKLLGGPQAGILVGSREAIAAVRRHPLFRALRPCKLTLGALEATLKLYLAGEARACERIPVLRGMTRTLTSIDARASAFAQRVRAIHAALAITVEDAHAYAGSGAAPLETLASRAVAIGPAPGLERLATRLRLGEPGIFPRLERDRLLLDFRSLEPEDDETALRGLLTALAAE